ncbi:MAG: hydroxyacid dehydrogenase [Alphaproteobacteria bacterium]
MDRTNSKRLAYFEAWFHPIADEILARRPDIQPVRLEYAGDAEATWTEMALAHGYQVSARTELCEPWFPDESLIARCPSLLAISSTGAGYDVVDVDACTRRGILVVNQSGTNKEAVAEHALGMMLCVSKQMIQSDRAMRRDRSWDRSAFTGRELRGKTVGVVGLGQIGTRTAELCRGLFHMRVLAYDPYLSAAEIAARGAEKAELADLLREADYISVHCPRTRETLDMFGAAAFAAMKPSAYFVNTARGGIHDEAALADALRRGEIAGAGIDVFVDEPPPIDHPLLGLENVVLSAHIAGITEEAREAMASGAAEQWITIFDGRRPPRLVNPEAWPAYVERFEKIMGFKVEETE